MVFLFRKNNITQFKFFYRQDSFTVQFTSNEEINILVPITVFPLFYFFLNAVNSADLKVKSKLNIKAFHLF